MSISVQKELTEDFIMKNYLTLNAPRMRGAHGKH